MYCKWNIKSYEENSVTFCSFLGTARMIFFFLFLFEFQFKRSPVLPYFCHILRFLHDNISALVLPFSNSPPIPPGVREVSEQLCGI